jgi:isopenicillin N synthase-like dioxygenase
MGPPADSSFPTPWPEESDLPGFRQYMESQYEAFQKLALQLMRAVEIVMQVPEGNFTKRCMPDASELRLNHYPAVTSQGLDVGNTNRIWPHTDTGLFSFVFQGIEKGLQVEDRKSPGRFVPVLQEGADEIIVIVANTLERWTNGNLLACVHQVAAMEDWKAESTPPRRSIVFFFRASGDKSAGPLPQFVSASQPARYDEITVSEYNQSRNVLQYG